MFWYINNLIKYLQVDYRWEDLRRCFVALDPHKTGCVSDQEFQDVMNEICVHLSVYDLEQIMKRHAANDHRLAWCIRLK